MTKEQIEKAAKENASTHFGQINKEWWARKNGFEDGVQWRISSVWHSTDELPKRSGFLAVLMDNGIMETMYYSVGIGFHEMTLKGYTSWAYVSDLLPERKEETK